MPKGLPPAQGARSTALRRGLGCLVLATCLAALVQARAEPPDWLCVQHWRQRDGLPQDSVYAIHRRPDGHLWVGTRGGLCRFDGVRFSQLDDGEPSLLRDFEVQALAEDAEGNLWIATYGGGVACRTPAGVVTAYGTAEGLGNDFALAIAAGRDGRIWVGTDGGLSCIDRGRIRNFTTEHGLVHRSVRSVFVDHDGTVWAGTDDGGVHHVVGEHVVKETFENFPPEADVRGIARDARGNFWVATTSGLYRAGPDGSREFHHAGNGLPTSRFGRTIAPGLQGDVWFVSDSGLLHYDQHGFRTVHLSPLVGSKRESVDAVCADAEGNVWAALAGKGLYKLRPRLFTTYTTQDGLPGQGVSTAMEDGAGRLWVGTSRGLGLRTAEGFLPFSHAALPPNVPITSLFRSGNGQLWIGADAVLLRSRAARPGEREPQFESVTTDQLPRIQARTILESRSGAIWVATTLDGLLRIDGNRVSRYHTADGLPDGWVRGLCEQPDGTLWAGTRKGLCRLQEGRFTTFTRRDGLVHESIEALFLDRANTLWIGTRQGLGRLKDGVFTSYGVSDGLFYPYVNSIAEDDHGRLWMGSARGPFYIEKKQLEDFAAGLRHSVQSHAFGLEHGLASTGCAAGYHPAIYKAADGRLWFATQDGISVVDPRGLPGQAPPPAIAIEEVLVDRRRAPFAERIRVPPDRGNLEIRYTGLSLAAPEKLRFRYKLDPLEGDWVEAGARRVAYYSNLPPGDYTFRVAATHNDGRWSERDASVSFRLAPRFYRTTWFYVVCGIAALSSGFGFHAWRTRQFRRRQAELLQLVAERQRAEEALRQSEERYRRFFEDDLAGAFIATPEGRILACNPAFARIFGFGGVEDAIRFDATRLYPSPEARDALLARLKRDGRIAHEEMEMRRADGKPVHIVGNAIGNFDATGRLEVIKGYVIDASEQKHLESQLQQARKMEAVGQLAGGIAHDFNNLLTGILSYSELLLEQENLDPEARESVQEIRNAGERAASLTHQLLAFSRRQILQPRLLDLNALISDSQKLLRRLIGEDITLVIQLASTLPQIKADPSQIHQILLNLAVNARDAMARGGRLTIGTAAELGPDSHEATRVVLTVSDTGCGMSPEVLAHIYEPFFTTKGPGRGTGLGLSTVYGIVKQSQGSINVHSSVNEGTRFEIRFPAARDVATTDETGRDGDAVRGGHEVILLVEDNEAVRKVAVQILTSAGYRVIAAHDANDALQVCRDEWSSIQLLLTDVVMPDMNGPELAERITQTYPHVKVLYMSGYTHDALVYRGGLPPGTTIVEKPFKPAALLAAVRNILDRAAGVAK